MTSDIPSEPSAAVLENEHQDAFGLSIGETLFNFQTELSLNASWLHCTVHFSFIDERCNILH